MAFSGKSIVVVTGASRGIGREIALKTAEKAGRESVFLLTARNESKLEEVKNEVKERCSDATVLVPPCDVSNFDDAAKEKFTETIQQISASGSFDNLFLYHNVGTVGDTTKRATELNDAQSWHKYFDVNLVSMIQMNNIILDTITEKVVKNRSIINITSLCAVSGFPSLCEYSVGKAARESYFRVLAAENSSLRVLNYSPGPVDTDMHDEIANSSFDAGIRAAFARDAAASEVHRTSLTTDQTVTKLIAIIEKNEFTSGGRIDYFDDEKSQ